MTDARKPRAKTTLQNDTSRPQNISVGDILRDCRLAKGMSIEDVAAAIHVRAIQLRAIEDNNIEALPGMTYAVGFVRSYANFLGLNGVEIVHKFKAEHGQAPAQIPLAFPEPVMESRMPDPMMIGIGAFLAVLMLTIWMLYSHGRSESGAMMETSPQAPVAMSLPDTAPETVAEIQESPAPVTTAAPEAVPDAVPAPSPVMTPVLPVPEAVVSAAPAEQPPVSAASVPAVPEPVAETPPAPAPVINIKRGKGRIVLKANQASWIQITDGHDAVIYKKVLRPGEQYDVPDQADLSLVTANAGGIDIYVDNQIVQPIGKSGEIVRGIMLNPGELQKKKIKVRD